MVSESATTTPFRTGLTPDHIIDVAVEMTRQFHLRGWSIRDLARKIDVAPSVLYHHIGGKDLIAQKVVERVMANIKIPNIDQEWDAWYLEFLLQFYSMLTPYPGVAHWVVMHGPTIPVLLPSVDACIDVLLRAGFGDHTVFAHSALLNATFLTIVGSDERLIHENDGPRDHAGIMKAFLQASEKSRGVKYISSHFLNSRVHASPLQAEQRREYFNFVVDMSINGVRPFAYNSPTNYLENSAV